MKINFSIIVLMFFFGVPLFSDGIKTETGLELPYWKILAALKNDVFRFYEDETKEYNTDLKKAAFKKTESYRNYADSLAQVKKRLLTEVATMKLDLKLSDFSMTTKSFKLYTGSNFESDRFFAGSIESRSEVGNILFEGIRVNSEPTVQFKDRDLIEYYLNLPCNEDVALYIENTRSQVSISASFAIKGQRSVKVNGYIAGGYWNELEYKQAVEVTLDTLVGSNLVIKFFDAENKELAKWSF